MVLLRIDIRSGCTPCPVATLRMSMAASAPTRLMRHCHSLSYLVGPQASPQGQALFQGCLGEWASRRVGKHFAPRARLTGSTGERRHSFSNGVCGADDCQWGFGVIYLISSVAHYHVESGSAPMAASRGSALPVIDVRGMPALRLVTGSSM